MKQNLLLVTNTILIAVLSLLVSKVTDLDFQLTFILFLLAWLTVEVMSLWRYKTRDK